MNSVFQLTTPRNMSFRLYGQQKATDSPFFLLEFEGEGFMRYAHHATPEHAQLILGGHDGQLWHGSTELTNLLGELPKVKTLDQLDIEFELDMPWDRALRFYSLHESKVVCECYRRLNTPTFVRVKE